MEKLIKQGGISLILGGIFLFITNAVITPFINIDIPFSDTAKTSVFLLRMITAAITAILLLFGSIGIELYQIKSSKLLGQIGFLLAFCGSAFLFANEWQQIFVISDLALHSPDALMSLDNSEGLSRYDIGSMLAILIFVIGWILLAISMLKSKTFTRLGPILIFVGFFATPIFSIFLPHPWGSAIGNAVLGYAFYLIGKEMVVSIKKT